MSKEFRKVTSENKDLRTENRELKETITRISEMNKLKSIDIYGRGSEKLDGIIDNTACQDEIDEDHEEKLWINNKSHEIRDSFYTIKQYCYLMDSKENLIKNIKDLREKVDQCNNDDMINQLVNLALKCQEILNNREVI